MSWIKQGLRFSGVANILKFNRPQYVAALFVALAAAFFLGMVESRAWALVAGLILAGTVYLSIASLLASLWIYDLSGLYGFGWLERCMTLTPSHIVRIHAGFDEAGAALKSRFPESKHDSLDFYDPLRHREASIEKARLDRRKDPECRPVSTDTFGLQDESADLIVLFLAAHEIRDAAERRIFFAEVERILVKKGRVVLVEHLRDPANMLVFGPGFLHFWSENEWRTCAASAGLQSSLSFRITPFVKVFVFGKVKI